MIAQIQEINGTAFSLNGKCYKKIFIAKAINETHLHIICAYDSKIELVQPTKFDTIEVAGIVYATLDELMAVLAPILFVNNENLVSVTDIYASNQVIDYSIEWKKDTYTYIITVRKYIFNGVLHTNTIVSAPITLDIADAIYNRFDSFLIDANENIIKWTGDALEFPYPKEFDLETYVLITFLRVDANTTSPTGLSEIKVFDEGTNEAGGEWTMTYPSGILTAEKSSVGANSIKLINKKSVEATSPINYEGRFLKDVLIDVWNDTPGNNRLRFSLWIANSMRVGEVYVAHGQFNYDAFLTGQWQTISIPGNVWNTSWGNWQYNFLWLNNDRAGSTVYLDNVRIHQTTTEQPTTSTHTHAHYNVLEQITQAFFDACNTAINWVTTNGANVLANLANKQNSLATDGTGEKYPTVDAVNAGLDLKVDKVTGKGLSTEDYTAPEKAKLASIDATHYLPPLQTTVQLSALIQASLTDKARVYVEDDLSDYFYDATAVAGDIAPDDQAGGIGFWRIVAVGGETPTSILTKYESNADRNAFTDALLNKINSITAIFTTALKGFYDTAYTHSQSAHAPTNAQKNSDILKAEIEAKLTGEITSHTHPASGGTGDMVLADVQTVSGEKTFLNLKLGLRNVADTFTSFFTNTNTATRTYILPDKDGTILVDSDLAAKANIASPTFTTQISTPKVVMTSNGMIMWGDTNHRIQYLGGNIMEIKEFGTLKLSAPNIDMLAALVKCNRLLLTTALNDWAFTMQSSRGNSSGQISPIFTATNIGAGGGQGFQVVVDVNNNSCGISTPKGDLNIISTLTGKIKFKRSTGVLYDGYEMTPAESTDIASFDINDNFVAKGFDLSQLGSYANDAGASAGGVGIGFAYINSSTGAIHRRLT